MSQPGRPVVPTAVGVVVAAAAVVALGAPLGQLWAVVAPEVPLVQTDGGLAFANPQPEQLIAADGWFAMLAVPFGVLAAMGVWAVRRIRGVPGLVALTAGALGAGLLAWWLGRQVGLAGYEAARDAAEMGAAVGRPADLRVAEAGWWPPRLAGVPLVPALSAALTYTVLAAWSRFPALRPDGGIPSQWAASSGSEDAP